MRIASHQKSVCVGIHKNTIFLILICTIKLLTMPQKRHLDGEGAIGSAVVHFFHSSKPICNKWSDCKKKCLTGIIILGQGECTIGHKTFENVYCCWIPEIEGEDFFIHPFNFQVDMPCPDASKIFSNNQWNASVPMANVTAIFWSQL